MSLQIGISMIIRILLYIVWYVLTNFVALKIETYKSKLFSKQILVNMLFVAVLCMLTTVFVLLTHLLGYSWSESAKSFVTMLIIYLIYWYTDRKRQNS